MCGRAKLRVRLYPLSTYLSLMYISYCISFPFLISLPHFKLQVTLISLRALLYPLFSSDTFRLRCNSGRYRKVFCRCGKVVKERESTVKFSFTKCGAHVDPSVLYGVRCLTSYTLQEDKVGTIVQ